ncbi:MAG: hypothetical protein FJ254_06945 [Phycisphaerae bacterium]|nr:hypothetical protein [Phycisphaerae bacterium]
MSANKNARHEAGRWVGCMERDQPPGPLGPPAGPPAGPAGPPPVGGASAGVFAGASAFAAFASALSAARAPLSLSCRGTRYSINLPPRS